MKGTLPLTKLFGADLYNTATTKNADIQSGWMDGPTDRRMDGRIDVGSAGEPFPLKVQ